MQTIKKVFINIFCAFCPIKNWRKKIRKQFLDNSQKELDYTYSAANFISPNTKIGKYCSIAGGVIIGSDNHPLDYVTTSPRLLLPLYKNNSISRFFPIEIGHDVWIGHNAIILPKGGCIGTGAVIGAGAVVTKDVPPYAIVAGVPAKIIRYRYPLETRMALLNSKWWEIPHEILCSFDLKDVNIFLSQVKKYNA